MIQPDYSPNREAVRVLWEAGIDVREIAGALGISTQRVYQQLHKLQKAGKITYPRQEAAS